MGYLKRSDEMDPYEGNLVQGKARKRVIPTNGVGIAQLSNAGLY